MESNHETQKEESRRQLAVSLNSFRPLSRQDLDDDVAPQPPSIVPKLQSGLIAPGNANDAASNLTSPVDLGQTRAQLATKVDAAS
jgi:hypothetical protein